MWDYIKWNHLLGRAGNQFPSELVYFEPAFCRTLFYGSICAILILILNTCILGLLGHHHCMKSIWSLIPDGFFLDMCIRLHCHVLVHTIKIKFTDIKIWRLALKESCTMSDLMQDVKSWCSTSKFDVMTWPTHQKGLIH